MSSNNKICVIGLGSMGMGIAQSCIRAGLDTYGMDLDQEKCQVLANLGGKISGVNCQYVNMIDVFILVVINANQCKAVLFGENGLASNIKQGAAVMLCSTMSAHDAKEIAEKLEDFHISTLDSPISGGAVKAKAGEITVMASGKPELFHALRPVFDAIADKVYEIGPEIGLGSTVKIIHQLLAGVHIAAGAEAMALASRAGIPLDIMYDVVTHAAGNSWMFENRMKHVVEGDYSPKSAVDIFVKDLRLVSETGLSLGFPLPLATTAFTMFANASNAGFGKEDDAAVIKTFSGIKLP